LYIWNTRRVYGCNARVYTYIYICVCVYVYIGYYKRVNIFSCSLRTIVMFYIYTYYIIYSLVRLIRNESVRFNPRPNYGHACFDCLFRNGYADTSWWRVRWETGWNDSVYAARGPHLNPARTPVHKRNVDCRSRGPCRKCVSSRPPPETLFAPLSKRRT